MLNILLSIFFAVLLNASAKTCKPLCKNNVFFNITHSLMTELEDTVTTEIKILELELKMGLIAQTIHFQKIMEKTFSELSKRHEAQSYKYETLLKNIGLSPAREDEINKIVEMEEFALKRSNNAIINTIYKN